MSVERLNTFYVCKKCRATFIFREDMIEHQRSTGHAEALEIPFEEAPSPDNN